MRIEPAAAFLSALAILICTPSGPLAQEPETPAGTSPAVRPIKDEDTEWHYIPGHCTCPPLISAQESSSLGTWERKGRKGEVEQVLVWIYQEPTTREAVGWMKTFSELAEKRTCHTEKTKVGDESYLSDCSTEKRDNETKLIGGPIGLWVRKDNFLISVNGNSKETVLGFGRYALRTFPVSR
jgi:hypothetical protein